MRRVFVMALALLLPACASVQMATTEADVQGKRFSPPPGQAALYVYREGMLARAVTMSVFVNQSRLGALAQDTWFRVDLDPGRNCSCSRLTKCNRSIGPWLSVLDNEPTSAGV
jgi:hypothetical protein